MPQWFTDHLTWWVALGFAGQALFSLRFIMQWAASERAQKSVVPESFWYFSLAGGLVLLLYAIHRHDPVFIAGQGVGVLIYLRNIWFITQGKKPPVAA